MKKRYEMKFLLNYSQYKILSEQFNFLYKKDPYLKGKKDYSVFSLYFDTKDKKFYYDKIDGYFNHLKVRARAYSKDILNSKKILLELKFKENEISYKKNVWKDNTKFNLQDIHEWDYDEVKKITFSGYDLFPAVGVYYDREAYFKDELRITFDKNIQAISVKDLSLPLSDTQSNKVMRDHYCVLEIKNNEKKLPEYVETLLKKLNIDIVSYSKYTESIDFLSRRKNDEL